MNNIGPYINPNSFTLVKVCKHCGQNNVCGEDRIKYDINTHRYRGYYCRTTRFECDACGHFGLIENNEIPCIVKHRIYTRPQSLSSKCMNGNCGKRFYVEQTTKRSLSIVDKLCCWNIVKNDRVYKCSCGTDNYIYSDRIPAVTLDMLDTIDRDHRLETLS